jgi:outer membrane protein OmpA-like peptidoglycan-associated protein
LAQEKKDSNKEVEELGKEQKFKYWDNWFISGGVAGNILFAEEDKSVTWSKRIVLGGEFSLGKWFNPNFGMRFQVIGGKLKGYNFISELGGGGKYTRPNDARWELFPRGVNGWQTIRDYAELEARKGNMPNGYDYKDYWTEHWPQSSLDIRPGTTTIMGFFQEFNYVSANVDLMANLTNLMRGYYKEGYLLDVIGFAGGGLIHAFDNKLTSVAYNGIAIHTGGRLAFNVNSKLAIYGEAQVNLTFAEFDGYVGDAPGDAIMNAMLGIQYTFNKDHNVPVVSGSVLSLDEINYLNEKINNNRAIIEKHQTILERQQDLLDRLNQCCEEDVRGEREVVTQTQIVASKYLPEYIRFTLNSTQIQFSEEYKFKEATEFLNANPSRKLLLVGYADKKTGTSNYNYDLSRRRVETVSEELIRRGINPNRLILEWRGDKEQPYAPNDWNRVVIMVER